MVNQSPILKQMSLSDLTQHKDYSEEEQLKYEDDYKTQDFSAPQSAINFWGVQIDILPQALYDTLKSMTDIHQQHQTVSDYLVQQNQYYYDQDAPLISDQTYDAVKRLIENMEAKYPELISEASPSQYVGGVARSDFAKVKHTVPMLSLQDYFTNDELTSFLEKIDDFYAAKGVSRPIYSVEMKIDGLSVSLEYKDGQFVRGSTRGDGWIGEDITENLRQIDSLPKTLTEAVPFLEVRAEVYMPYQTFEALNDELSKQGKKTFANPRNAAAGSLRQHDPLVTKARQLDFFVFNIQQVQGRQFDSHIEGLKWLQSLGFPVVQPLSVAIGTDEVFHHIQSIYDQRAALPYGIDGAVVKIDRLAWRDELGQTGKVPRWAAAYKYPAQSVTARVVDIVVQMGRTGAITPLALIEPTVVDGSTVSRATLHNEDYIQQKDIQVGDTVWIQKAGDGIPAVVSVVSEHRPEWSKPYQMPHRCPACDADLVKGDEAALRCPNEACPERFYQSVVHFVSTGAMDIDRLGAANIRIFIRAGLIQNVADIYRFKDRRYDLLALPSFLEKSVDGILSSIDESRKQPADRLLYALGIRHVGAVTASKLLEVFGSIEHLMEASEDELIAVQDIGIETARAIRHYFSDVKHRQLIEQLKLSGLNLARLQNSVSDLETLPLAGQIWVVTGKLEQLTRSEAKSKLAALGATVVGSVSKNTTHLLCGEKAGSKLAKAQQLGIHIIDEAALFELIGDRHD